MNENQDKDVSRPSNRELEGRYEITPLMHELGGIFAWTKQDDDWLTSIMTKRRAPDKNMWASVAKEFSKVGNEKSEKECCQRWHWYLCPPKKNAHKRRFTAQEDAIITNQVLNCESEGEKPCWISIARQVNSEGNRVRERWNNILNPKINHLPFSKDEDVRLYEGLREHGQKWSSIAKDFFQSTRSDTQLKNRFRTVTFRQFHARVSERVLLEAKEKRKRQHASIQAFEDNSGHLVKRLKASMATKVLQEDVPRPLPGKLFTPLEASQILAGMGSSERRTVMLEWIEKNYVPVNLTSLYRALDRYKNGKTLKSKWCSRG